MSILKCLILSKKSTYSVFHLHDRWVREEEFTTEGCRGELFEVMDMFYMFIYLGFGGAFKTVGISQNLLNT